MQRYHVVVSTDAGYTFERELEAIDAAMAAFIITSRYVDRDDITTGVRVHRIDGGLSVSPSG